MSLRHLFLRLSVSAGLIIGAICLIFSYWTSRMHDAATQIEGAVESVRAAEELQIHLLAHHRQSLLLGLLAQERYRPLRDAQLGQVEKWFHIAEGHVDNQAEADLLREAEAQTRAYLNAHADLEKRRADAEQIYRQTNPLLQATLQTLEHLTELNLTQARAESARSSWNDRVANLIALAIALCSVAVAVFMWRGLRRWIFHPVRELHLRILGLERLTDDIQPVPESGATEVQSIARAFNALLERLRHQRQARLRFLASVAHDLRNPLSAIRMSTDLLRPNTEEETELVRIIRRQSVHLERLVGDLLDQTQIEAGNLTLRSSEQDLGSLVEEAVKLHQNTSAAHPLNLTRPSEKVPFVCDPARMNQVLHNLLSNALKYSPHGGPIDVELREDANELCIRVRDRGLGIEASDQVAIFEPFRRSSRTRDSFAGVGLGLSVTKKIVEAHGGRIRVESEPGKGSTFELVFPRRSHETHPPPTHPHVRTHFGARSGPEQPLGL